jgi:4-hydroxy-4-methyl-2-oxoglutarate aldolase
MEDLTRRIAEIAGTGPISDAMEMLGLPRGVITGWRLVSEDPASAIIGPAFPLRQAPKSRALAHDENLTRQREASGQLAQPGDVIVIDAGGRTDISTWGENQSLKAHGRGVAGLVVHGAIRDCEAVRRSGFRVLCRGVSPVASRWDLETVAMNEPVVIAGVGVQPGDLMYGDADGLLVIPRSRADEVIDRALAIDLAEGEERAALHG